MSDEEFDNSSDCSSYDSCDEDEEGPDSSAVLEDEEDEEYEDEEDDEKEGEASSSQSLPSTSSGKRKSLLGRRQQRKQPRLSVGEEGGAEWREHHNQQERRRRNTLGGQFSRLAQTLGLQKTASRLQVLEENSRALRHEIKLRAATEALDDDLKQACEDSVNDVQGSPALARVLERYQRDLLPSMARSMRIDPKHMTRELHGQMNREYEAYLEQGMSDRDAMCKAMAKYRAMYPLREGDECDEQEQDDDANESWSSDDSNGDWASRYCNNINNIAARLTSGTDVEEENGSEDRLYSAEEILCDAVDHALSEARKAGRDVSRIRYIVGMGWVEIDPEDEKLIPFETDDSASSADEEDAAEGPGLDRDVESESGVHHEESATESELDDYEDEEVEDAEEEKSELVQDIAGIGDAYVEEVPNESFDGNHSEHEQAEETGVSDDDIEITYAETAARRGEVKTENEIQDLVEMNLLEEFGLQTETELWGNVHPPATEQEDSGDELFNLTM